MTPGAISPEQLAALLEQPSPHALLDVRERAVFERGHIYRATPLPRRLLELRLPMLVTAPATLIVLYDDDGTLSALAAPTLGEMGYTEVFELTGGLDAWRRAGRPVVQGLNVPSKVFGERVLHEFKTPEITPLELSRRMADGHDMVIVDTRTPEEYARGCLPGAVSMPGGELVLRIGELVQRPDQTIVVHCGGRTRSYLGAESLRRMGLPNPIVAVRNGTMGWQLDGLELERGASRWPPVPSEKSRARALEIAARVAAEDGTPLVSAEAVAERWSRRQGENVTLFDVRTRQEYDAGHVPGSIWVPGGQAVQATDDNMAVRAGWLVLICDGYGRSIMTAGWLKRMGFPHVAVLEGGVPAWAATGRPLEAGEPAAMPFGFEAARRVVEAVPPGPLGDAMVVSVDPSDVYQRGHVPGARWIGGPARAPHRPRRARHARPRARHLRRRRAVHPGRGDAPAHGLCRRPRAGRRARGVESGRTRGRDRPRHHARRGGRRRAEALRARARRDGGVSPLGRSARPARGEPARAPPRAPRRCPGEPMTTLPDPLVSTEWLAAHLGEPDLRVVDATFYLPHLGRDARAEFEQAHLPGAVFFDIDAISDHADPLPHMLPDATAFADAVGALGIGTGDRVIAYGGRGLIASARAWWTFRVFGHDRVAVLDGGSAKWKKEGRPLESGMPTPTPRRLAATRRKELVADLDRMLAIL
jgi:3-mercaptopyruvate sulfurtransferase SseA